MSIRDVDEMTESHTCARESFFGWHANERVSIFADHAVGYDREQFVGGFIEAVDRCAFRVESIPQRVADRVEFTSAACGFPKRAIELG